MKNSLLVLTLCWSCAYLSSTAQNTASCNANFEFTVTGHNVQFTPAINSVLRLHHWEFSDGTFSNDPNPTHFFANAGTYRVLHRVYDSLKTCFDTVAKSVTIVDTSTCSITAAFNFYHDSLHCKVIHFINQSVPFSTAMHFAWKFGDSTTSNEPNPTHEFAKTGIYNVCLVVEQGSNCRKEICKTIEVTCGIVDTGCNVHAKFEGKHDSQQWNKIWFANTTQPLANIWRTAWTYGDGSSSQDFNSFHTYDKAGKYYVCLKVISLTGCVSTYCDSVIVVPPVVSVCDTLHVKFVYQRSTAKPNVISFAAVSSVPLVSQRWVIRRDSLVNGYPWQVVLETNDPTYIFPMGGWYNVCLYATTRNSCVKEYCEKIFIDRVVADSGHREIPVSVYPNPTRNSVNLMLNLDSRAPISVMVVSADGIVQQQLQVGGQTGNNIITIPVDKLSQGQYLVRLRYAGQVRWARFQKL